MVPENRLRVYDTRAAMAGLVDEGSLLMLRTGFGAGIHTAFGAHRGPPVGLIANNPLHLGGAIDDGRRQGARFMQLCNAHGLPLVSLVDTPGFMVGPEVEQTAQVRHVSRLFVTAAALRVPFFSVVLRKGLAAWAPWAWRWGFPCAGVHHRLAHGRVRRHGAGGAVRLGFLQGTRSPPEGPERDALFQKLVASGTPMARPSHGRHAGDRRRHRPGGHARLAGARLANSARVGSAGRPALRRYLVEGRPARPWRWQGGAPGRWPVLLKCF